MQTSEVLAYRYIEKTDEEGLRKLLELGLLEMPKSLLEFLLVVPC